MKIRILIAGYSYEDSLADNVRCALEEMGHEVRTLGDVSHASYYAPWRSNLRAAMERARKKAIDPDGRRLIRIARSFRPEIVLALTREYTPDVLMDLKRISKPILIMWWGDPAAHTRRLGLVDEHWDLLFLKDAIAAQKTRLIRDDVYLLHEAMNPRWHRPITTQNNQSIVVAGNWYGFRQALANRLMKDGVSMELYGPTPPIWALPAIRRAHSGRYIVREEKSRVFGEALACLNSFQYSEGNTLNQRAFEIAGAAGLQLIEHRPIINEYFEPDKEILIFRTYDELLDLIERARKDPGSMRRIREAGTRRALAEHTYRHRLEVIFGHLK